MSINALQKAVFETLVADAAILALTGPGKVFDNRPVRKAAPYLVIGAWRVDDWSSGTEAGAEHIFEIEVWSEEAGRKQAAAIAEAVQAALHDADLALPGFHLVGLRHRRTRTGRERNSRFFAARIEFRAAVEH